MLSEQELNSLIDEYAGILKDIDALKEKADTVRQRIAQEMDELGLVKTETLVNDCRKSSRTTIKYLDEPAIIAYCEATPGMSDYVTKKINASPFNKAIKASQSLQESLRGKYEENTSFAISVTPKGM